MGSDNIVEFAKKQGWWNPHEDDDPNYLNLQKVYGTQFEGVGVSKTEDHFTAMRVPPEREKELATTIPVSLEYMLAYVRDPRWSNDKAGYGQVAHLRPHVNENLQTLWLAVTHAVTTPYVPIPIVTDPMAVPLEFVQHRYLTNDSSSTYLSPDFAYQEATRYATREFKRLLYFSSWHPVEFYPYVTGNIENLEINMLNERPLLEEKFLTLLASHNYAGARQLISQNVWQWFSKSLNLGMQLTDNIEAEIKRYGIRMPKNTAPSGETTTPWSQSMSKKPEEPFVNLYDPRLGRFPRKYGIYSTNQLFQKHLPFQNYNN